MKKKLQTIYEYLKDYTEKQINYVIDNLSYDDKSIIRDRYGEDLHNPVPTERWNSEKSKLFYGILIPKMKRLLAKVKESEKPISIPENIEQSSVVEIVQPKIELVDNVPLLLQLLKEGKSNREICETLNINTQQLYEELLKLKNRGITHLRRYYSDGSIKYNSISTMKDLRSSKIVEQDRTIITDSGENSLKVLVISDLHFGNELERIDMINRAYNYCVKNGINIILCGGDIIDGAFTQGNQKITNLYRQVEYFLQNYPCDKNILTFAVAGDHDISIFNTVAVNLTEICDNYRHDIIIGGYNNSSINIKNDCVHLYHHIETGKMRLTRAPIILHGHSHKFSTEMKGNTLNVTLPTLSSVLQEMPGALEMNLYFKNGYIENTVVKHLYFGKQDILLGEFTFDLSKREIPSDSVIRNVESYKAPSTGARVLTKPSTVPSQIDKFNKRWKI